MNSVNLYDSNMPVPFEYLFNIYATIYSPNRPIYSCCE